jgi:hypothetical protein
MKKLILILVAGILSLMTINCYAPAGGTYEGDYTIKTSSDLSALNGYTKVTGTLEIKGTMLKSLAGLESLTEIGGSLVFSTTDAGKCDNDSYIPMCMEWGNAYLENVDGLNNLKTIGGKLNIAYCKLLNNLNGLGKLTAVGGSVIINTLNSLTDLSGLAGLSAVKGDLILQNITATNLTGFNNLTSVSGTLNISQNQNLVNIDALGNLIQCADINIYYNMALTDINGLSNLVRASNVSINSNDKLLNINALRNLFLANNGIFKGDIAIKSRSLNDISAFNGLSEVGGYLFLSSAVTDLTGLNNLKSIGGRLSISENYNLVNIDALAGLTSLGVNSNPDDSAAGLVIDTNPYLLNINGLRNLFSTNNGVFKGRILLRSNRSLHNLSGFIGLTEVTRDLTLEYLGTRNLSGLDNLVSVGGGLYIIDNYPALENLTGLNKLTSVNKSLQIYGNEKLINLDALANLTFANSIDIYSNTVLPTCEANELRDRFIAGGWQGTVNIHDNNDAGTCD